MEQRTNYADSRQTYFCAYCRGGLGTRDHVPSKVFLDKPYPKNLPVVFACKECNESFSLDEEYIACLIECIKSNSCNVENLERENIKEILSRKPKLLERIKMQTKRGNNYLESELEKNRIKNVLLKLAKGHLLYEFNTPITNEEININYFNLLSLDEVSRLYFEIPPELTKMPEVGCRALGNIYILDEKYFCFNWNIVQAERYRYLTGYNGQFFVRIVIGESLACEAIVTR